MAEAGNLNIAELFALLGSRAIPFTLSDPPPEVNDLAVLSAMHRLATGLSDDGLRRQIVPSLAKATQDITSRLEQVALNPQPLPPQDVSSGVDEVALNPQPLPPEPRA
jgi:hypothetical protein